MPASVNTPTPDSAVAFSDPAVKAECAGCGRTREPDKAGPYREHAERDPFCSSTCCMAWHGVGDSGEGVDEHPANPKAGSARIRPKRSRRAA